MHYMYANDAHGLTARVRYCAHRKIHVSVLQRRHTDTRGTTSHGSQHTAHSSSHTRDQSPDSLSPALVTQGMCTRPRAAHPVPPSTQSIPVGEGPLPFARTAEVLGRTATEPLHQNRSGFVWDTSNRPNSTCPTFLVPRGPGAAQARRPSDAPPDPTVLHRTAAELSSPGPTGVLMHPRPGRFSCGAGDGGCPRLLRR